VSKRGCLSAQMSFATAQAMTVAITGVPGTPFTVTVPASTNYFHTELLAALQTLLDAASGADGAFTVSSSVGEAGTGLVTIAHATQTITITWTTATELRDALGFAGTLTPAALSFTGTLHARGVWLPDCPHSAAYGPNDAGHTKSDRRASVSPRGDVWATKYTSRVVLPSIRWSHVGKAKARISGETTTAASFEQWWRHTHNAELSYFSVAPQVRLIWDADIPGTYTTYRLSEGDSTEMPKVVEDWNGLYALELRNLIKVPS
jgi:hypothetical protein